MSAEDDAGTEAGTPTDPPPAETYGSGDFGPGIESTPELSFAQQRGYAGLGTTETPTYYLEDGSIAPEGADNVFEANAPEWNTGIDWSRYTRDVQQSQNPDTPPSSDDLGGITAALASKWLPGNPDLFGTGQYHNPTASEQDQYLNAPVPKFLAGVMEGVGTYGNAPLGLAAKASGSPVAQAAYEESYKTNEGGTPGLFDIPAEARGLSAAEQARQQELSAIGRDTSLPFGEQVKGGLGAALYGALPYVMPIAGAAEAHAVLSAASPEAARIFRAAVESRAANATRDAVESGARAIHDIGPRAAEALDRIAPTAKRFATEDSGMARIDFGLLGRKGALNDPEIVAKGLGATPEEARVNLGHIADDPNVQLETQHPPELPKAPTPVAPRPVASQADVVRGQNAGMRPWEMSPEELGAAHASTKAAEANIEVELFGEQGAKEYKRAQAISNSTSGARSVAEQAAADETISRMEGSLTKAQQDRLFGIGETGPNAEDLREYRDAIGRVGGDTPQELGDSIKYAVTKVGEQTDPALMNHTERVAYAQIRHAMEYAKAKGWDLREVSRAATAGAAARFGPDAEFMLQRFSGPKKIEPPVQSAPTAAQKAGGAATPEAIAKASADFNKAAETIPESTRVPNPAPVELQAAHDEATAVRAARLARSGMGDEFDATRAALRHGTETDEVAVQRLVQNHQTELEAATRKAGVEPTPENIQKTAESVVAHAQERNAAINARDAKVTGGDVKVGPAHSSPTSPTDVPIARPEDVGAPNVPADVPTAAPQIVQPPRIAESDNLIKLMREGGATDREIGGVVGHDAVREYNMRNPPAGTPPVERPVAEAAPPPNRSLVPAGPVEDRPPVFPTRAELDAQAARQASFDTQARFDRTLDQRTAQEERRAVGTEGAAQARDAEGNLIEHGVGPQPQLFSSPEVLGQKEVARIARGEVPIALPADLEAARVANIESHAQAMQKLGASKKEIQAYREAAAKGGVGPTAPPPEFSGKQGVSNLASLAKITPAQAADQLYRTFVVNNLLNIGVTALKAGADLVQLVLTTAEIVGRPLATKGAYVGSIPGELAELWMGPFKSLRSDAGAAFLSMKYGIRETDPTVFNRLLNGAGGPIAQRMAQGVNIVSLGQVTPRTLSAVTAMAQHGFRDQFLFRQAYKTAVDEGLNGVAAYRRAGQLMDNPPRSMLNAAQDYASTKTWTNANEWTSGLNRFTDRAKPGVGTAIFTAAPFTSLVTNMMRQAAEFIPGANIPGLLTKVGEKGIAGAGTISADEMAARRVHAALGAVVMLAGYQKAMSGELTGNGPSDINAKVKLLQTGWKPNSIRLGDAWYTNRAFGPLAPMLDLVGNYHDNMAYNVKPKDWDDTGSKLMAGVSAGGETLLDQLHWLNGGLELLTTWNSGNQREERNFAARFASGYVPQSGNLKLIESATTANTPAVPSKAGAGEQMSDLFRRQFPGSGLPPGIKRPYTGASRVVPLIGEGGRAYPTAFDRRTTEPATPSTAGGFVPAGTAPGAKPTNYDRW